MAGDDIERRIRALEDREAIRDLPRRYADHVWHQNSDGVAELFTEAGRLDLGGGELTGHDAIREYLASNRRESPPRPMIHNHVFELAPDGQSAAGRCVVHVAVTLHGENRQVLGLYDDEYAREDGRWKFRSRRSTMIDWKS